MSWFLKSSGTDTVSLINPTGKGATMVEKTEGWEFHITEMDLFSGLDLTVMGQIADTACTEAAYADATVVFNEGDPAKALFILVSGSVDLQIAGGKTVYRLTEESDIFGWSSLVENARYTATAICRSDIQAVKIDTRLMNRVFDANPMVGLTVYRRLGAVFNKRLASIYGRFLSV